MRQCGACTLCCKLMGIVELDKPADGWCPHCRPGSGCRIYDDRPASCRTFVCGWLADLSIPETLRPDRSKVVLHFTRNGDQLIARCDPASPLAWRKEPMYGALRRWAITAWAQKRLVLATAGDRTWLMTPRRDIDLGVIDPDASLAVRETPDGGYEVRTAARTIVAV